MPFFLATSSTDCDDPPERDATTKCAIYSQQVCPLEPVAEAPVFLNPVLATPWLHRQGITNCSVVALRFHTWWDTGRDP